MGLKLVANQSHLQDNQSNVKDRGFGGTDRGRGGTRCPLIICVSDWILVVSPVVGME